MPVIVVRFPKDPGKKVNMSKFLSKYQKREFSVIVDVSKEDFEHIFKILNRNDCKVLIAQDQALIVDFEIYFLFFVLDSKIKEGYETNIVELNKKSPLFQQDSSQLLKRILNKLKKNQEIYLEKFRKEYIISSENKLFFDWDYRVRVLFDSITISALDLNRLLNELEIKNQLDLKLKILFALYFGYDNLAKILNFIDADEEEIIQEIDELIKNQIVYKNPYRPSEVGKKIIKFINEYVQKISPKISIKNEIFLNELTNNKIKRQLSNLLITLCFLTIKNRRETGYLRNFKEFRNLYINPKNKYL
ncbi:MAG: hypothetical protein ACTSRG_16915 [Candidatus Helarchaeota archaeon]